MRQSRQFLKQPLYGPWCALRAAIELVAYLGNFNRQADQACNDPGNGNWIHYKLYTARSSIGSGIRFILGYLS